MTILHKLFGLKAPVTRKLYFTAGVTLMLVKYAGEIAFFYSRMQRLLLPQEFLNPIYGVFHLAAGGSINDWLLPVFFLWSLPFFWIGLSMSIRRAQNSGISPWWGTLFFVPYFNLLVMLVLSLLPERPAAREEKQCSGLLFSGVVWAMAVIAAICFAAMLLYVDRLSNYGAGLFMGAPVLAGLVGGYILNRERAYTQNQTLWAVFISLFIVMGIFLLVAFEGVVCILMAAPLTVGLALPAALLGRSLALQGKKNLLSLSPVLLMIPGFVGYDLLANDRPLYQVYSSVEIAASPEKIWPIVIAFPELAPPKEILFKAGIAYPIRAHIEGQGVGAVRYCEFSTGPFVEPITVWEPGERLAFDVTKNPKPMTEFNPFWKEVDAPHLHGFMESKKGEFGFVKLANGHTRLEGRTWYRQGIFPQVYWKQFSDEIIHRIHLRVLNHIKAVAER
jgi:uncharacterized membrane protein YhaH (DUF805 family)